MTNDKRSAWLQKLDKECPYQVVLPRRQLMVMMNGVCHNRPARPWNPHALLRPLPGRLIIARA